MGAGVLTPKTVPSYMGVWIEISLFFHTMIIIPCHILDKCVDQIYIFIIHTKIPPSFPYPEFRVI